MDILHVFLIPIIRSVTDKCVSSERDSNQEKLYRGTGPNRTSRGVSPEGWGEGGHARTQGVFLKPAKKKKEKKKVGGLVLGLRHRVMEGMSGKRGRAWNIEKDATERKGKQVIQTELRRWGLRWSELAILWSQAKNRDHWTAATLPLMLSTLKDDF